MNNIVRFIYSFADKHQGLEKAAVKFKGIRLNVSSGFPRKPDGRYWLYPLSAELAERLTDRGFKYKVIF